MASKARRPASAIADLREQIRTEGVQAAYAALVAVCRDPKAPAQARATASTTIFRSAGLLERVEDDLDDKPIDEMTRDELDRYAAKYAHLLDAPGEMVDAGADLSSAPPAATAAPERAVGPAPARRPRRAAAKATKPATGAGSSLDDFG